MTMRSVLLTAVPLALLAVCAAVLLLACGTVGKGALADVDDIIKVIEGRME